MKYALVSWFDSQKVTRYTQLIDEMFYSKKEKQNCIAMPRIKFFYLLEEKKESSVANVKFSYHHFSSKYVTATINSFSYSFFNIYTLIGYITFLCSMAVHHFPCSQSFINVIYGIKIVEIMH